MPVAPAEPKPTFRFPAFIVTVPPVWSKRPVPPVVAAFPPIRISVFVVVNVPPDITRLPTSVARPAPRVIEPVETSSPGLITAVPPLLIRPMSLVTPKAFGGLPVSQLKPSTQLPTVGLIQVIVAAEPAVGPSRSLAVAIALAATKPRTRKGREYLIRREKRCPGEGWSDYCRVFSPRWKNSSDVGRK